jgi:hypothetical protein
MAETRSRVVMRLRQSAADGRLPRRFTRKDFERACPGLGRGTYNAFLWKHREGNPGGKTYHFEPDSGTKWGVYVGAVAQLTVEGGWEDVD